MPIKFYEDFSITMMDKEHWLRAPIFGDIKDNFKEKIPLQTVDV